MYLEHFGLSELPFTLSPNTKFLYEQAAYREALNVLMVAIRSGEGFVKITAEVGRGKTLLCRKLLRALGEEYYTAYVPNPSLTPAGLRWALAEELGLVPREDAPAHIVQKQIMDRLMELNQEGKQVVLLLDEAQALPIATLESLRLLSNLETETTKLLQIVLFGQPEFDALLGRPVLRQLKQRITFDYRIPPLDAEALRGYVYHRLRVAGCERDDVFTPAAIRMLHETSRGVPRVLNILCHKSMMAAYGRGDFRVDAVHVRVAARDTEAAATPRAAERTALSVRPSLVAAASALLGLGLYFWSLR